MIFSICRIAGRTVAFLTVATVLAAKPLPVVAAPKATTAPRFPTANGNIKYRMTMGNHMTVSGQMPTNDRRPMSSSSTVTWANYGARFRQDTQIRMNVGGRQMNMNSWSLYDGKAMYTTLPNGMLSQPTNRKIAIRMMLPPNYLNRMAMGNSPLGAGAGRLIGRGTILGKPCEIRVTSFNNLNYKGRAKIWMWQKLPLRSEIFIDFKIIGATANMKTSMIATQLNTDVKPSPSLFRLPTGYKVQEMSDFQKQMQQRSRQR